MTETLRSNEKMLAMNEALVLGSLRQHELAEASDNLSKQLYALNAKLHGEIAERERTEALLSCQKKAFEMVAMGAPLIEVLEFLALATERQSPQHLLVAIHLLDKSGTRFEQTAAPSLPPGYSQVIDGMAVSSDIGPCCAAVAQRRRVVVPDIAASKAWPAFAALALPLGLRAAWSAPIFSASGNVLGTLVNYCREVCEPDPQTAALDEIVARTAAVVIERKQAEATLRESQARLQFVLESAQIGDWDLDLRDDTAQRSLRHDQVFGYTEPVQQWGFETFIRHVHPEDRAGIEQRFRDAVTQQHEWRFECRVIWPDGSVHWIAAHGSINRTPEGQPRRMQGIVFDITERKQAEERQLLLTREIAHRGGNLLAVVQSIVARSLSGTLPVAEMREILARRIQALSRGLLVLQIDGVEGVSLGDTIRSEFEIFSDQIEASGPVVLLKPQAAQTVALVVHELATNASKYGALSQPEGQVALTWSIEGAGADARFKFHWQERGGPPVVPPSREGFGRMVLEKAAEAAFGAAPKISFAPEGLRYELDVLLSDISVAVNPDA